MTAVAFVRKVFEAFRANSGLEPRLLDSLRVTSASAGKVHFELPIEKHHTNRLGILHGGTIASMGKLLQKPSDLLFTLFQVDLGGSLALASRGMFSTGVSTDLNVTYLNEGGKIGDVIKAEAVCDKFGKTLAFTSIRFINKNNELVARGSHTKYVVQAAKDPQNSDWEGPGKGPKVTFAHSAVEEVKWKRSSAETKVDRHYPKAL